MKEDKKCKHEHCECGCEEDKKCTCNHEEGECKCNHEHHDCDCGHDDCDCRKTYYEQESENELVATYLSMAQRLQADFDNYRKQAEVKLMQTFTRGQSSIIEAFLPCLDTFKKAKQSILDKNVLQGVEMIENQIMETLKGQGVEKIVSVGEKYDPNYHNVIAVMKNEEYENDVILDEYEAGYMFKGQVLRYAKVIVNKLD